MTQDPIKLILETETKGREDIEILKKTLSDQLTESANELQENLIKIKKESNNELEKGDDNLKSEAKKAYIEEFEKFSKESSEILDIDTEKEAKNIVSEFFNKIAA